MNADVTGFQSDLFQAGGNIMHIGPGRTGLTGTVRICAILKTELRSGIAAEQGALRMSRHTWPTRFMIASSPAPFTCQAVCNAGTEAVGRVKASKLYSQRPDAF